ncbi:MAG: hypothetical protein WC552_10185 [Candidatus Omnitrophota bacterium]
MPNRILREGILASERMARLSWAEEVFYRRLMSVVDDFGRYDGRPAIIRAACYPLALNKATEADIGKWILATVEAGLVSVYSVDGREYIQLLNFRQQTRAKRSKFPAPPEEKTADAQQAHSIRIADTTRMRSDTDTDTDTNPPIVPTGDGGERPKGDGYSEKFIEFWEMYPKKVGKKTAWRAWKKIGGLENIHSELVARIFESVYKHKKTEQWRKNNGQFIPHPATFLNQARWEDEISEKKERPSEVYASEDNAAKDGLKKIAAMI